jgi:ATP-binding cassette subfamily B protein
MAEDWRVIRSIVAAAMAADRRLTIATGLLAIAGWIVVPLQALAIAVFVDAMVRQEPAYAVVATLAAAVTVGGLWYFNNLRQFLRLTLNERTVHHLDQRIQAFVGGLDGIEHLERPDYLDRLATLRTQSWLFGNVGVLFELPALTLNLAISAILLVAIDPRLIFVPFAMLPSIFFTGRSERALQTAEAAVAGDRRLRARVFEMATDPVVAGEARLFESGGDLLARHTAADQRIDRALIRAAVPDVLLSALGWAFYAFALGLVFVVVVDGISAGGRTIGELFLAFYLVRGLTWQAQFGLYSITNFRRTLAASRGYLWLADHAAAQERTWPDAPAVSLTGALRFESVTFRYPGAEQDALRDVSLHVPAGTVLAVVGDNGAGKSTMVKLLARFYEPRSGRITIGGDDILSTPPARWRERLTACFQDFCRFELVAAETIGVGDLPAIDDLERVGQAVTAAGASDVVARLPEGLSTPLGSSWPAGAELSVGQWQKVALSRAMMRLEPRLLLLDEPTAALDADSEAKLFERYATASRFAQATGSITIIVSHRMSTVRMADLIAVVDGGRIVEAGTHDDLITAKGAYFDLYSTQAAAYRN